MATKSTQGASEVPVANRSAGIPEGLLAGLTVFTFNAIFANLAFIMNFLAALGLIHDRNDGPLCCGKHMVAEEDSTYHCGYRFRCNAKVPKSKKTCRKTVNAMAGTWFGTNSRLSFLQVLQLTFLFVCGYRVKDPERETGISEKPVIDFFVFCREVCSHYVSGSR